MITTVFVASLLGSLHCAGMCGVFVVMAGHDGEATGSRPSLQAMYHLGRLLTYMTLGGAAGWLGSCLDLGGAWFGIQRAALLVAGVAMIGFGLAALLRLVGVPLRGGFVAARLRGPYLLLLGLTRGRRAWIRALATGLFSTLLPCGWLYAFVVAAGGTGSVLLGAMTMLLFWSGTLPVLGSLGWGMNRLSTTLRFRAQALLALALVLVGAAALTGRIRLAPLSMPDVGGVAGHQAEAGSVGVAAPGDPPACHAP